MSQDRITYLERIEHYRQRFGFLVYAYVLMVNHIHFLVETKRVPLSNDLSSQKERHRGAFREAAT